MIICLDIASAIFAFIAAVLWFLSARIKMPREFPILVTSSHFADSEIPSAGEVHSVGSSKQLDDLGRAVIKQSALSSYAAGYAAVAAVCQGLAIFVRLISN